MSNRILFGIIGFAVVTGILATGINYFTPRIEAPSTEAPIVENPEMVACTMDAMQCPDGSYVGRSGPNCEFVCPPLPEVSIDVQAQIDAMRGRIVVDAPVPLKIIESPLTLTGEAIGSWYFEASAPVSLVNWDGLIIAEGFVTARGDWMTPEFVPFEGELTFESPYKEGDPDFMKRGTLIFQNDNPTGLPEKQFALEIPVRFAQ